MDKQKKCMKRYISLLGMMCVIAMLLSGCECGREGDKVDISGEPASSGQEVMNAGGEDAGTQAPVPTSMYTPKPTGAPTMEPTGAPAMEPTKVPTMGPTTLPVETTYPMLPEGATYPALSVEGTKLVDASGNQVQLRGVSTHGLAWFPGYVNEECFRQLKEEWGANVVRLAMYTAENGGYCTGGDRETLKALIEDGVEYATNQGLYVIIDWHILSDGNPNTYLEEAKSFFAEMAEKYADYTNVLYEICNEPNGGTGWSQVKEYAEAVISVIREKDEDGIILVGTPNWCQYVDQAAADPIIGYENIMYTLHFYAATHTDNLRNSMVSALNAGLPLFVSEYGICDASGSGNIDEYQAGEWVKLMDEYQVSYVAWNLSNKAETSAFFKSDCNKTSGFTAEDLSASGMWVYEMLREGAGISGRSVSAEPSISTSIPPTEPETPPTESVNTTEQTKAPVADGLGLPQVQLPSDLVYTASQVNSWQQDGNTCVQYTLTITNGADTTIENWSATILFEQEISLMSGWNGTFQVEENQLTITPADYNSSIPAGGSVNDIGFILQIIQK